MVDERIGWLALTFVDTLFGFLVVWLIIWLADKLVDFMDG